MSLLVNTFKGTPDQMEIIEVDHSDEIAGFESCRRNLWGSSTTKSLGCVLLPALSDQDLYIGPEQLELLRGEVNNLLKNVSRLVSETQYAEDYIQSRCKNILRAIDRAQKIGGSVVIW